MLGRLIAYVSGDKWGLVHIVYGLLSGMAIFFVVYIPLMAFEASFTVLCVVYSVIILALCAMSLIKSPVPLKAPEIRLPQWRTEWVYFGIFVVLAVLQLYFAIFYTATNQTYDDYEYVVSAVDTITSDRINASYSLDGTYRGVIPKSSMNSWSTYTAYLAKTSGLSVPVVCHTVLSVAFLVFAYIVFYLIASFLFLDSEENRLIFMDIVSIAVIFGSYSHNAISFRLLATAWQGKAVLAAVVIPFALLEMARIFSDNYEKKQLLLLLIISLSGVTFTMLGTGLMLILCASMYIVMSLYRKKSVSLKYVAVCILPALVQVMMYVLLSYKIYGGLVT